MEGSSTLVVKEAHPFSFYIFAACSQPVPWLPVSAVPIALAVGLADPTRDPRTIKQTTQVTTRSRHVCRRRRTELRRSDLEEAAAFEIDRHEVGERVAGVVPAS